MLDYQRVNHDSYPICSTFLGPRTAWTAAPRLGRVSAHRRAPETGEPGAWPRPGPIFAELLLGKAWVKHG